MSCGRQERAIHEEVWAEWTCISVLSPRGLAGARGGEVSPEAWQVPGVARGPLCLYPGILLTYSLLPLPISNTQSNPAPNSSLITEVRSLLSLLWAFPRISCTSDLSPSTL